MPKQIRVSRFCWYYFSLSPGGFKGIIFFPHLKPQLISTWSLYSSSEQENLSTLLSRDMSVQTQFVALRRKHAVRVREPQDQVQWGWCGAGCGTAGKAALPLGTLLALLLLRRAACCAVQSRSAQASCRACVFCAFVLCCCCVWLLCAPLCWWGSASR